MSNYYQLGLATPQRHSFLSHRIGVSIGSLEGPSGFGGTGVFADIPGAIDEINRQIQSMESEIEPQLNTPELMTWYRTVWLPWLAEWKKWSDKHSHWYHNMFLSSWHEANDFADQLLQLHGSAIGAGLSFMGPAPSGASESALDKAIKSPFRQLWSMLKILIYAGAIIAGIIIVRRF